MKISRTIICALPLVLIFGCTTPDPVKGWKSYYANLQPPNEHHPGEPYYQIDHAVIDDYQGFVEKLKKKYPTLDVAEVYFYEDGTGQHAVRLLIETGLREYVEYYLMYDKSNVRTRV